MRTFDILAFFIVIISIYIGLTIYHTNDNNKSNRNDIAGSGEMFNQIAPYYDLANTWMSLGYDKKWRNIFINHIRIKEGERILDLATGTGEMILHLLKYAKSNKYDKIKVYGIDPSIKMLDLAKLKIENEKFSKNKFKFLQGNAEKLDDINSETFDKVIISFGIRNFQDPVKGLKEIRRVLKLKGKLFIMEFTSPQQGYLSIISRMFIKFIVPIIGAIASRGHVSEYQHLEKSIFNFPDPENFKNQISQAGFNNVRSIDIFYGIVHIYKGEAA